MFEALNERLSGVFDRITGRGVLTEGDVDAAMREVRVALLEADVALPVVKDFIAFASERAQGEDVIRSVKPADQVIKIVHDGLIEMLGGVAFRFSGTGSSPPSISIRPSWTILMTWSAGLTERIASSPWAPSSACRAPWPASAPR